jgi:hypothetical protein
VWHASVAKFTPIGPVPTSALTRADRRIGAALALRLIEEVGFGPTREETKEVAIHARRSLSDDEIAALDPGWLAIPAVDMG